MINQKLEELLIQFKKELVELGNKSLDELTSLAIDKINKNKLEVAFIGRFSVGKSTLINSLLKKDLLPSSTGSTTSKLAFIKKGNENFINVNYIDGNSNREELSKPIIEKLSSDNRVLDFEIYLSDFPFDNVVFVDTPGVEDVNNLREDVTYGYLPTADVIIFVLDVSNILTKSELEFYLNHISSNYQDKVFLVFNKADMEDQAFSEIETKIEETLEGLEINKNNRFIVSARNHLAGILLDKSHLKNKSNIFIFEEAIKNYLLKVNNFKIQENKILDYIDRAKDISLVQLKASLDSIDKNKLTLENELEEMNKENKLIKNKILEVNSNLEQIIKSINNCIETYFDSSIEEISHEFISLDTEQKIYFIKHKLPNKIRDLLSKIRNCTENKISVSAQLKDINLLEDVLYSFLNKMEDGIAFLVSFIAKLLNDKEKTSSKDDKVKEFIGNLLKKVSSLVIDKRIENIFLDIMTTFKKDIQEQLRITKKSIIEEIENNDMAELEAKEISIKKSILNLESDNKIFSDTKESINKKMNDIETLYSSIRSINI